MELFKYCDKKYNVMSGSTLRLGALHHFRKIENDSLRDEKEGTFTIQIDFSDGIILPTKIANLFFQSMIGFGDTSEPIPRFNGSVSMHADKVEIDHVMAHEVKFKSAKVTIERSGLDSYIFCCSMNPVKPQSFSGYNDHWKISNDKIEQFGIKTAQLVLEQLKLADFNFFPARNGSLSEFGFSVNLEHRPIKYIDRVLHITQNNLPSYEEFIDLIANMDFYKPSKFKDEMEYRYKFIIHDNGRIYTPQKDFIDLNTNEFYLSNIAP
ncbi:TPA: hypothetical protein ACS78B_003756 [Providencia alcalifaciens]